jgi:competence protein ComEA
MISRGATISDDEIDPVVDYLATHFGPGNGGKLNVNKADASQLSAVLEISAADANAIVSFRTQNGSFKSWQDLAKVPGLDIRKLEAEQDRVEY